MVKRRRIMEMVRFGSIVSIAALLTLVSGKALALPGQTTEEVTAWIQGHPTLRPSSGEKLLVRKSDTPAQRFIFQASVLPVGKVAPAGDPGVIRHERLALFDMINGITMTRLEESLRVIYGVDVYQDYERARVVYAYPTQGAIAQAQNRATPLLASLMGELRLGDRFAYWAEIAQTSAGYAYTGQITVLVKEDLGKLEGELRSRVQASLPASPRSVSR
ncbi:MAG: hypothetical protein SFW36_02280 [Leptolyngbyaceae cyanobacterium bins.59]|nr:hypothetical protein [Leptolyngbyaceae cyanobacterium bins.59]